MNYLFVQHAFPGSDGHVASHLAGLPENRVMVVAQSVAGGVSRVETATYEAARPNGPASHPDLAGLERGVLRGRAVLAACLRLKAQGFRPDIMVGHNDRGETLYLKTIWPGVPLLAGFASAHGAEGTGTGTGHDPEPPATAPPALPLRNALTLIGAEAADWGHTPTRWQHALHPPHVQAKLSVIHEGVDSRTACPDPAAWLRIDRLAKPLTRDDEVITCVAHDHGSQRGFQHVLSALPGILRRRSRAQVLIVVGDAAGHEPPTPAGATVRRMLEVAGADLDPRRVHVLGKVPHRTFLNILQISSVHLHAGDPLVASRSCLEAMAAGCLVVGSDTVPVREVIRDGENGLLVDVLDARALYGRIDAVLDHPDRMAGLRAAARRTVLQSYDLHTVTLPAHLKLMEGVVSRFSGALPKAQPTLTAWNMPMRRSTLRSGGAEPAPPSPPVTDRGDRPAAGFTPRPAVKSRECVERTNQEAQNLIKKRRYNRARDLLLTMEKKDIKSYRMLFNCNSATGNFRDNFDLYNDLLNNADDAINDLTVLRHYIVSALNLGMRDVVQGILEGMTEKTADARIVEWLARLSPAVCQINGPLYDAIVRRSMELSDRLAARNFNPFLRMAHDLAGMGRWQDYEEMDRILRREATSDDQMDRIDLLSGQVAFLNRRFDEQVRSLNRILTRQSLESVHLTDTGSPVSVANMAARGPERCDEGPLVSVLMTAYNREGVIGHALRSLLGQTHRNLEIIVIDDASRDGTARVVAALAGEDRRISCIGLAENRGTYIAKNIGLAAAKGEFVVSQDSDDWAHPEKIASLAAVLMADPGRVGAMVQHVRCSPDRGFRALGGYIRPDASSLMFRREPVLERIGYYDSVRAGADAEFQLRMEKAFGPDSLALLPKLLSIVDWSTGSLSGGGDFLIDDDLGLLTPARSAYKRAFLQWHESEERHWLPFPLQERPFPVEDAMRR